LAERPQVGADTRVTLYQPAAFAELLITPLPGLGILPGGGPVLASFMSYGLEKRVSKEPQKFGTGAIEGVASPEAANNSAASSSFIPLLTLGIPPNVSLSVLFGAFLIFEPEHRLQFLVYRIRRADERACTATDAFFDIYLKRTRDPAFNASSAASFVPLGGTKRIVVLI
jgi:hypothetical protein